MWSNERTMKNEEWRNRLEAGGWRLKGGDMKGEAYKLITDDEGGVMPALRQVQDMLSRAFGFLLALPTSTHLVP